MSAAGPASSPSICRWRRRRAGVTEQAVARGAGGGAAGGRGSGRISAGRRARGAGSGRLHGGRAGCRSAQIEADLPRIGALRGHVLIVLSAAVRGQTLRPRAPLRLDRAPMASRFRCGADGEAAVEFGGGRHRPAGEGRGAPPPPRAPPPPPPLGPSDAAMSGADRQHRDPGAAGAGGRHGVDRGMSDYQSPRRRR